MKRRREYIEVEPGELTSLFRAPQWLRNLGIAAWLLVGVAAALAGAVWLLALTQIIVLPVITAGRAEEEGRAGISTAGEGAEEPSPA